jgi:O-antigen/teichoic acid export membrane protein
MQRLGFIVFRNAIANVLRGGASALVAVVLPHFLVHALVPARFDAWSLILQIAAYASYLDFGLQMAVSRFLAQAIELDQRERQQRLIGTALALLSAAGAIALLGISLVIAFLPNLFRGIPPEMIGEVRQAALLLGGSAAILLPASTFTGILIGMHRNDLPALAIGGSRLAGAAAVVLASRHTQSLITLAACIAVANLFGAVVQWWIAGHLLPAARGLRFALDTPMARELLRYCYGLTVFAFGAFLISGLDLTILGHFDFRAVGYYAIASMMVTFVAGLNHSLLSALMTPLAALQAQKAIGRIRTIMLASTRAHIGANLLGTGVLFCFGPQLLHLWVGDRYAASAYPVMQILMLAQALRLVPNAYATMLIATGQQSNAIGNTIVEAAVNLIASIAGAAYFGARGVAYGTLIGAAVGIAWVALWTVNKDRIVGTTPRQRAAAVFTPIASSLPMLIVWLATRRLPASQMLIAAGLQAGSIVCSALLLIGFGDLLPGRKLFGRSPQSRG